MSDETTQPIEQAGEVLFDSVYVPSFLKRCSDMGITYANDDELVAALQNVLMLKVAEANSSQNNSGENMHKTANLMLRNAFGEDVEKTASDNANASYVAETIKTVAANEDVRLAAALLTGEASAK